MNHAKLARLFSEIPSAPHNCLTVAKRLTGSGSPTVKEADSTVGLLLLSVRSERAKMKLSRNLSEFVMTTGMSNKIVDEDAVDKGLARVLLSSVGSREIKTQEDAAFEATAVMKSVRENRKGRAGVVVSEKTPVDVLLQQATDRISLVNLLMKPAITAAKPEHRLELNKVEELLEDLLCNIEEFSEECDLKGVDTRDFNKPLDRLNFEYELHCANGTVLHSRDEQKIEFLEQSASNFKQ